MYGKTLITAAVGAVLSTADAKAHLRVDHTVEDTVIAAYVAAATRHLEDQTNRQLLTATWDITFDRFPVGHERQLIPLAPLQAVTQIVYVDQAGASQTITSGDITAEYTVVTGREPGEIAPKNGKLWPYSPVEIGAVTYRVRCGYGLAAAVDPTVVPAIKLLTGHWYECREDTADYTISTIPRGVQTLIESLVYDDLVDYDPRTLRITHSRSGR